MTPTLHEKAAAFAIEDRGVLEPPVDRARLEQWLSSLPFTVPTEVRDWLATTNGSCLTHGGTYGLVPRRPCRDLNEALSSYPSWLGRCWLPVAWDGFGNEYAIDCKAHSPSYGEVWFFEMTSSEEEPAYKVAQSLPEFLDYFFSVQAREGKPAPAERRA